MSCHRSATWPPEKAEHVFRGLNDLANEQRFDGRLKLDFLWSIEVGASANQRSISD